MVGRLQSVPTARHDACTPHESHQPPCCRSLAGFAAVNTPDNASDGLLEQRKTPMVRKGGSGRIEGIAAPNHHARATMLGGCGRLGRVTAAQRGQSNAFAIGRRSNRAQNEAPGAYLGRGVTDPKLARHVDVRRAARPTSQSTARLERLSATSKSRVRRFFSLAQQP